MAGVENARFFRGTSRRHLNVTDAAALSFSLMIVFTSEKVSRCKSEAIGSARAKKNTKDLRRNGKTAASSRVQNKSVCLFCFLTWACLFIYE